MPNHTTSTLVPFDIAHSIHNLLDGKKLLIACYLLYAVIVECKAIHQPQKPLRATKIVDIRILHRSRQRCIIFFLYLCSHIVISLGKHLRVDTLLVYLLCQLVTMQFLGCFVCKLLRPLAPKLFGSGGCGITHLIDICRQQ